MENSEYLDTDSFYSDTGLYITQQSKQHLKTATFWGKIVAIFGFVGIGFMVLAALGFIFASATFSQFRGLDATFGVAGAVGVGFAYLLLALLYFFPVLYLFNFSNKTQEALRNTSNMSLEDGFKNLKSLYKFMGIMMFVIIGLYVMLFFVGLIGGAML